MEKGYLLVNTKFKFPISNAFTAPALAGGMNYRSNSFILFNSGAMP